LTCQHVRNVTSHVSNLACVFDFLWWRKHPISGRARFEERSLKMQDEVPQALRGWGLKRGVPSLVGKGPGEKLEEYFYCH